MRGTVPLGVVQQKGVAVLRRVLKRMRWDNQGGYPGRHKGKWHFISSALPQTTPKELDALFALVGVEPDEIQSLGECGDCLFAEDGRERGYREPCGSCLRPKMSNFKPKGGR